MGRNRVQNVDASKKHQVEGGDPVVVGGGGDSRSG